MKLKHLLTKTLLVAAGLLAGASNVWADEVVGEGDFSTGYLEATSAITTMTSGGSLHYVFTVTKTANKNWQNWILYVGPTGEAVTWANGFVILRGDNWEDKWRTSASDNGSAAGCWNDFEWGDWDATDECHPDFCSFMNGATVDMTVTYESGMLNMVATVEKESVTKNYKFYKFIDGAPESVDACLSVNGAQLTITTADYTPADPYYNVTRILQDFSNAGTINNGWSYQNDNISGSLAYAGGQAMMIYKSTGSGNRWANLTLSTLSAAFATVSDYCFEYDFNTDNPSDGGKVSTITVKASEGTLFSISSTNGSTTAEVFDAASTKIGEFTNAGTNAAPTTLYHFAIKSSAAGTFLTITQNGNTVMAETKVNDGLVHLTTIENSLGRYMAHALYDNIMLRDHSDTEIVTDPTIEITGVSGESREVTITSGTSSAGKDVTTYYTIDGSDPTSTSDAYTAPITIDASCTLKAISISAGGGESGIVSLEITTGAIVLNTPTWTKTGYDAGVSTVTLADNQSDKLLNPATTIKYQINDGDVQTYSAAFTVNDGEALKYWAEATGYTNSAEGSVTAMAPCAYPVCFTETYNGTDNAITVNTEEVITTIGGSSTPYYYMYANETAISENLLTSNTGASNWLLRATGIYSGNTVNYALSGVQKNDVVTINIVWGAEKPVPTATDGTLDMWNSTVGSAYVFKVTSTMGNFRFSLGRYASVKSISIQRGTYTATVDNKGYATFNCDYALDLTGTDYAFQVTGVSGETVTLEAVTGKVVANTPLILVGEGEKVIPVATSGAEDISATNKLVAVTADATTIEKAATGTNYVLAYQSGKVVFAPVNGYEPVLNKGKAYLHIDGSEAPQFNLLLEGAGTTGIENMKGETVTNNGYYNLNGQRVAQPTKGLYIVNGRVVVIK